MPPARILIVDHEPAVFPRDAWCLLARRPSGEWPAGGTATDQRTLSATRIISARDSPPPGDRLSKARNIALRLGIPAEA